MTNATSIIIADKAQMANSPVYGRISFFQQPCSFLFAACTTCVDEARLESLMTEPSSLLSSSARSKPRQKRTVKRPARPHKNAIKKIHCGKR
jgi:hypothetical protein